MKREFEWHYEDPETGSETTYQVTVDVAPAEPDVGIDAAYVYEIYVTGPDGKIDDAATCFIRGHRQDVEEAFWEWTAN